MNLIQLSTSVVKWATSNDNPAVKLYRESGGGDTARQPASSAGHLMLRLIIEVVVEVKDYNSVLLLVVVMEL